VSSSPAAAAAAAADDDDDDDAPSGKPYVLLALFTYSHTSETIRQFNDSFDGNDRLDRLTITDRLLLVLD